MIHCVQKMGGRGGGSQVNLWGKRFKLHNAQLTNERFLTIDHSCKIFFWYLPNWTSTDLWCVVLYVTYSTTHQRSVEVQFGRYQKNILQEWSIIKKFLCVSCAAWNFFPINSLQGGTYTDVPTKLSTRIELQRCMHPRTSAMCGRTCACACKKTSITCVMCVQADVFKLIAHNTGATTPYNQDLK